MKIFIFLILIITLVISDECQFTIKKAKDFSSIKTESCKTVYIDITSGNFILKNQIKFNLDNLDSLVISGKGEKNSKLIVKNHKGAFAFKLNKKHSVIKIENLSIYCMKKKIKHAISIVQPIGGNQHRRNVILNNLEIANFNNNGKYFFENAIFLKGVWRPLIDNVFISGFYGSKAKKTPPNMKTCFELVETYSPSVINSRCWSSEIGLNILSNINPGPEGLMIDNSKFVETNIGINIDFLAQEPGGFITDNHINANTIGINIKNRKFFVIRNNLMYRSDGNDSYSDINLVNVDYSMITNNIFHFPSKINKQGRKEINLIKSSNNVISGNLFTKESKKVFGKIIGNHIYDNFAP